MKITTEQIKNLSVKHDKLCVVGFARELIALAQEVKPLKFKRKYGSLWCKTEIGGYCVRRLDYNVNGFVFLVDGRDGDENIYLTPPISRLARLFAPGRLDWLVRFRG